MSDAGISKFAGEQAQDPGGEHQLGGDPGKELACSWREPLWTRRPARPAYAAYLPLAPVLVLDAPSALAARPAARSRRFEHRRFPLEPIGHRNRALSRRDVVGSTTSGPGAVQAEPKPGPVAHPALMAQLLAIGVRTRA